MNARALLGTMLLTLLGTAAVPAQTYRAPQPTRPTLSPWLNLYNRNPGPLDNYHMYVRPELELRDTLRRQDTAIQRQTAGLENLGQQVQAIEREETLRPTGTGSVFMDYSHYYPGRNQPPRPRGVSPRPPARPYAPGRSF